MALRHRAVSFTVLILSFVYTELYAVSGYPLIPTVVCVCYTYHLLFFITIPISSS